jgi:DNA replication and repair protein RecF
MRSRIRRLTLTDYRSYAQASLETEGRSCFLFGPNGAGKTNLLEAISQFSPGRGLRGATAAEVGRKVSLTAEPRSWAVSAEIAAGERTLRLGVGVQEAGGSRRSARIDGESGSVAAFADYIRPLWLTPALDRLFSGSASERRRFLDRLVFSAEPGHAYQVTLYERALRERLRLLAGYAVDRAWLAAIESQAARAGALVAMARAGTIEALAVEIAARPEGPFPRAEVGLDGEWEAMALAGVAAGEIESGLPGALAEGRARDAAAGRALRGPHRSDLAVIDHASGRPAGDCSTGEQKALILNLILAQAGRLSRAIDAPNPILLLDEVAAHLDQLRRAALFDEIETLSLQAFLTGTDAALFDLLQGRALRVRIETASLTVVG